MVKSLTQNSAFKLHICNYYRATQRLMAAGPARPIAPPDYALEQVAFHLGLPRLYFHPLNEHWKTY